MPWRCGNKTLIGLIKGGYAYSRLFCKSYKCRRCGPKKTRRIRKCIAQRAVQHGLTRFLTLTLDPKKLKPGCTLREKIAYLYRVWRKMRVYLQRRLGKPLVFVAVVELQSNGTPHLHLLVGSYLPKAWISASWQALGGGWSTRIEYADIHRVAAYLSNYITEDSLCTLPNGTRRFSTSRGLALFAKNKSDGTWILTHSRIETWRLFASAVQTESFETDDNGNCRLVSFIGLEAPNRQKTISRPKEISAVLNQARQFVYTAVLRLKELFRGEATALKAVLAQHIGQLTLIPKQTPQGALYEVSGGLELLPTNKDVMQVVARDGVEPLTPAASVFSARNFGPYS